MLSIDFNVFDKRYPPVSYGSGEIGGPLRLSERPDVEVEHVVFGHFWRRPRESESVVFRPTTLGCGSLRDLGDAPILFTQ